MIGGGISGVDFITVDTDAEALAQSRAPHSICLSCGASTRERFMQAISPVLPGTGPAPGGAIDQQSVGVLKQALAGSDMVFVVGGLGGRTATRMAPTVAAMAREDGALTTAIVTFPFAFEGRRRAQVAEQGIRRLKKHVNTLIVVPNDRLLEMAGGELAFHETYRMAYEIWLQSIQGISELVNAAGLVNVDFADVRSIMERGDASIIATGCGFGPDAAREAAEEATHSPYLDVTIDGARSVLFNVTGGPEMSLHEVKQAAAIIKERAHPEANIIFGATIDVTLRDEIRMTVVASGCGATPPQKTAVGQQAEDILLNYWQEPSVLSIA
jgi:cell division protein FtsZ